MIRNGRNLNAHLAFLKIEDVTLMELALPLIKFEVAKVSGSEKALVPL